MGLRERGFFSIDALFAVTLLIMISSSFLHVYEGRKEAAELMGARLEAQIVGEKLEAVKGAGVICFRLDFISVILFQFLRCVSLSESQGPSC